MQQEKQFEQTANDAENKLLEVEKKMNDSLLILPESLEEILQKTEKITDEKADELAPLLNETGSMFLEEELQNVLKEALVGFPPILTEKLIQKLLLRKEKKGPFDPHLTHDSSLAYIIELLGKKYSEIERQDGSDSLKQKLLALIFSKKLSDDETKETSLLSLSFSQDDFGQPPSYLGSSLSEKMVLTFFGDVDHYLGWKMNGGEIIVWGKVRDRAGFEMTGGEIIIHGGAGGRLGESMEGGKIIVNGNVTGNNTAACMGDGTLIINGEVTAFDWSAFSPNRNNGTIIWKGVTIWSKKKWTKEGLQLAQEGKIPGISALKK